MPDDAIAEFSLSKRTTGAAIRCFYREQDDGQCQSILAFGHEDDILLQRKPAISREQERFLARQDAYTAIRRKAFSRRRAGGQR